MGQIGSAMSNPVTFQKDPQGFSGSEWGARFLGGGIKGLANGLQNQPQTQQGGAPGVQVPMAQQPNVQLPGLNQPQRRAQNDLTFYGSSY